MHREHGLKRLGEELFIVGGPRAFRVKPNPRQRADVRNNSATVMAALPAASGPELVGRTATVQVSEDPELRGLRSWLEMRTGEAGAQMTKAGQRAVLAYFTPPRSSTAMHFCRIRRHADGWLCGPVLNVVDLEGPATFGEHPPASRLSFPAEPPAGLDGCFLAEVVETLTDETSPLWRGYVYYVTDDGQVTSFIAAPSDAVASGWTYETLMSSQRSQQAMDASDRKERKRPPAGRIVDDPRPRLSLPAPSLTAANFVPPEYPDWISSFLVMVAGRQWSSLVPAAPQASLPRRSAPSGGDLGSVRIVLTSLEWGRMGAGWWEYDPDTHELVRLRPQDRSDELSSWMNGSCKRTTVLAAVSRPDLLVRRYKAFSYRLTVLDAGVQLLQARLVAHALGLRLDEVREMGSFRVINDIAPGGLSRLPVAVPQFLLALSKGDADAAHD